MCERLASPSSCLRGLPACTPLGAKAHVVGIGGDRELSHGDLPTAIMAGVTHNNADVIAPSQPISSCATREPASTRA